MNTSALTAQNSSLFEIDTELEAAFDQMAEFLIKRGVRIPKALRHLLAEARISRESLN